MARRKKDYASDYSSDSEGQDSDANEDYQGLDPDERAERELFEQNSGRKKRRLNKGGGKASAWEGIFGEDDEDVGRHDRKGKRNAAFKWVKQVGIFVELC
jgi:tuftelin-interacting protein 11